MNFLNSVVRRAAVKMSIKRLRRVAIQGVGINDRARNEAMKPPTSGDSGPGSVKEWTDAMKIDAPKKITSFIRRKFRH